MSSTYDDAIRELDESILIISDMNKKFNGDVKEDQLVSQDFVHLHKIYERIRQLSYSMFSSYDRFDAWIGPIQEPREGQTKRAHRLDAEIANRLYDFTQGLLHRRKLEGELERAVTDNTSLKKQLSELRQREATYLSLIYKSKAPLSSESKDILVRSLRSEEAVIAKNLSASREAKAKYGLNVPVDIRNSIDQYEADLEAVLAKIAELEKREPDSE